MPVSNILSGDFPKVPIEKEKKRFENFLSKYGNERIIFSGLFGSGKTYFLNNFFLDHKDYICIHLYPINYSVASNEDIFEYIKFDILYELISKKVYLDKIDLKTLNALTLISSEEFFPVIKDFIEIIPEIGKSIGSLLNLFQKFQKIVVKKKKKITTDQAAFIADFYKQLQLKKGSIFENDFYTELITELIQRFKKSDDEKKIVLIVDDLDRIDPEHIFRILNVLAVHFKNERLNEYQNKFDIDKIILCCDIVNVRAIFASKYGQAVDFSGYIDKFYSKEIYFFSNSELLKESINNVINSISSNNRYFLNQHFDTLHYILKSMIESKSLAIRSFKKLYGSFYSHDPSAVRMQANRIRMEEIPVFQIFDFLCFIIGNSDGVLSRLEATHFPIATEEMCFPLIVLADFNNHQFLVGKTYHYKSSLSYCIKKGENYFAQVEGDESGFERLRLTSASEFKDLIISAFKGFVHLKGISYKIG